MRLKRPSNDQVPYYWRPEAKIRARRLLLPASGRRSQARSLGLEMAQGTASWDRTEASRAFSKRYFERVGKMPNMSQGRCLFEHETLPRGRQSRWHGRDCGCDAADERHA